MALTLNTEVWESVIQDSLFQDNSFLNYLTSFDDRTSRKVINIPISGGTPNVVVNRTQKPAQIQQRTDTLTEIQLDEYSTDPFLVEQSEVQFISYDKVRSMLAQHTATLRDQVNRRAMFNCAPEGTLTAGRNFVLTTGTSRALASNPNLAPVGATGNRLDPAIADIAALHLALDAQNVPASGRYLLPNSAHYWALLQIGDLARLDSYGQAGIRTGQLPQVYGFNLLPPVPNTPIYNVDTVARVAFGASGTAAEASFSSLAFHSDFLCRALGSIEVFENLRDATMYGDVYSALVYFGAGKMRGTSNVGVAALLSNN